MAGLPRLLRLGLLLALLWPAPLRAQAERPVTVLVRAGFDGLYRANHWLPVLVQVSNDGPGFVGTFEVLQEGYDGSQAAVLRTVELPTRSRKAFFVYLAPGAALRRVTVTLRDGRTEVASAPAELAPAGANDLLYGVVSNAPSAFNPLTEVDLRPGGRARVALLSLDELPEQGRALEALDALIISGVDTGALSEARRRALAAWVTGGGLLLATGGPDRERTAAGLEALLPLRPAGERTLDGLAGLAALLSGGEDRLAGRAVVATGPLAPGATPLAVQDGLPLAASWAYGTGRVIYLAPDPALAPLRGWDRAGELYRSLLSGGPVTLPPWAAGEGNAYYARRAAGALPALALPPALLVCGILLFYVALIGPANYLLLKRLGRRELAWLTVPALALLFSAGAYLAGGRVRGRAPVLERLAVMQVWPGSDMARVDGVLGVYSPTRSSYQLLLGEGFLMRPLAEDGGGPGAGAAQLTLEQGLPPTSGGEGTAARASFRLEIAALQALLVDGVAPAPRFESDLSLDLSGVAARLGGQVSNASDLTLHDAALLALGAVTRLGTIAPGAAAQVSVTLAAGQATPAQGSAGEPPVPFLPGAPQALKPRSFPGAGFEGVIGDILGNADVHGDRDVFRRYALMHSVLDSPQGEAALLGGVYLLGWTGDAHIPAALNVRQVETLDSTLVVVTLHPRVQQAGSGVPLRLPPALFTWSLLGTEGTQASDPSPYGAYLYDGSYTLSFRLAWPVAFRAVEALTLHLSSSGQSGASGLAASLWNFEGGQWASLGPLNWGDLAVGPAPGRYVSAAGEVRLRIERPGGAAPVSIERSDFTLVVSN